MGQRRARLLPSDFRLNSCVRESPTKKRKDKCEDD